MNIVPKARFDDGNLHLLAISVSRTEAIYILVRSFLDQNSIGKYRKGHTINITTKEERYLQTNGELYRKGKKFKFEVLPGALKIRY